MNFRQILTSAIVCAGLIVPLTAQNHVAVMELRGNNIADAEAGALTDRLRTELFRTGSFRVLERELMDKILDEQGFQMSGCTSDACLVEIGQLTGMEMIIGGSISKVGSVYSISARTVSVQTGEILHIATFDYEGEIGELLKSGMRIVAYQLAGRTDEVRSDVEGLRAKETLQRTDIDPDYSKKMAMYKAQDKTPWVAGTLSFLLPSTGHAYAGHWGKSVPFLVARIAAMVFANTLGTSTEVYNEETAQWETEFDTMYNIGMYTYIGIGIWETSRVVTLVKKDNQQIYDRIFGRAPELELQLVPQRNGLTLQLACAF